MAREATFELTHTQFTDDEEINTITLHDADEIDISYNITHLLTHEGDIQSTHIEQESTGDRIDNDSYVGMELIRFLDES
jgi:hypothetical protein